jgi:23S rRNA pseudouridine1911/1915/1917 synthase
LVPVPMDLDILYEDASLLVLNKPAGISVHPGAGMPMPSLLAGVLAHVASEMEIEQLDPLRPGVVHRLDKDTTGVIVFAKTLLAHQALSKQFHDKTNERNYLALLDGLLPVSSTVCESFLHRDPHHRLKFASTLREDLERRYQNGIFPQAYRWAKSLFTPLQYFGHSFTYVQVQLHTGRTHQIRVHAQSLGHPVMGDPLYQRKRMYPTTFPYEVRGALGEVSRQMLHASSLAFTHPVTQDKMSFEVPVPADFQQILTQLAPFARKVV